MQSCRGNPGIAVKKLGILKMLKEFFRAPRLGVLRSWTLHFVEQGQRVRVGQQVVFEILIVIRSSNRARCIAITWDSQYVAEAQFIDKAPHKRELFITSISSQIARNQNIIRVQLLKSVDRVLEQSIILS